MSVVNKRCLRKHILCIMWTDFLLNFFTIYLSAVVEILFSVYLCALCVCIVCVCATESAKDRGEKCVCQRSDVIGVSYLTPF